MRLTITVSLSLLLLTACGDDTSNTTTTNSTSSTSSASGGAGGSGDGGGGAGATGGSGGVGGTSGNGGAGGGNAAAFTFFVTSEGSGALGGNLGGLVGADAICQKLATAAGVGNVTWHAYLSSSSENARERIGTGPWSNFDGDVIAANVNALHADGLSNGNPQHIMDEYGSPAPASQHDIFTGSDDNGMLFGNNATCNDWTSDSASMARVGHSDIPNNPNFSPSWNNAHNTQGCAPNQLQNTGGSGRLYCFAL